MCVHARARVCVHARVHVRVCVCACMRVRVRVRVSVWRVCMQLAMTGRWPEGRYIAGAAALAVERVNADSTLLPGHAPKKTDTGRKCSVRISFFTTSDPRSASRNTP